MTIMTVTQYGSDKRESRHRSVCRFSPEVGFVDTAPIRTAGRRRLIENQRGPGFARWTRMSPKLWLSSRLYPLTPVWSFFRSPSSPGDHIIYFALIALLISACVIPRREILIGVFTLLALLALQDQSRWQPWFYQYVVMLLAIALAGSTRPSAALNTCCLIVAAIYIWSGFAKLNPNFVNVIFPSLLEPFMGWRLAPPRWLVHDLAFVAPLLECVAGVGLLTRRFRKVAVYGAIAMHILILMAIGPLGSRFNVVVWPWNFAMIAFLLILFLRRADNPGPQEIIWGKGFAFQKVALLLFGLMPALSAFNLWDHYLSSALYSGIGTRGSST